MRIWSIDSRGNARRICHAKKYYVIYLRLDGLQACLRVTGSFPEDFRDIPSPRRGSTGDVQVRKTRSPKSLTVDLFPSRESRTVVFTLLREVRVLRTSIVAQREQGEGAINFYDSNRNRCQTIARYRTYVCNMNAIRGFRIYSWISYLRVRSNNSSNAIRENS